MKFKVIPTYGFQKEAKRLIKKYVSLKTELLNIGNSLETNPTQGIELGNHTFKIRIAIKSKGKGKSGGARLITYVLVREKEVYLLRIYDKSEISSVDNRTLSQLIKSINP